HPELLFEERFAAELLCDMLERAGLEVERGAYGLETAFAARAGSDGPTIAVLCEYDALPGIGHGCGHNVIATAGLGAGLAAAALRQHIRPNERVHGVFTNAGDKPNIAPDHTVAEWYVRSGTIASLQPLKERVLACLQAGADAAGCRMAWRATCPEYSDLRTNPTMAELYLANSERVGRRPVRRPESGVVGSTDMGNVSYLV